MTDTKKTAQSTRYKHEDFQEELPVDLTDAELLDTGARLGETLTKIEEVLDKKKETNADFKHQLEKLKADMNRLQTLLKRGYDLRSVNCVRTIDYETRVVIETRVDTGEVLRPRACKPSELQMEADLTVLPAGEGEE